MTEPAEFYLFRFLRRISIALQFQSILAIGFLFCLLVSYFYAFQADGRFPTEYPSYLRIGFFLSLGCATLGYLIKPKEIVSRNNLSRGVQIVFLTWMIACCISAVVFVAAGFPIPTDHTSFSVFRSFIDGLFESMSGFTTAGGSILPSVEALPRGILMRRSTTHFIGGMGIAYMAGTFFKRIFHNRTETINAESEGPTLVLFDSEQGARRSGFDFFKVYVLITLFLILLLTVSGMFFRITPYAHWYDAIFDAINYAFSTMGTGGFGTYDTSAGLFTIENGQQIIGGLRNPTSEWIIAFFMLFAGMNFGLRYELLFYKRWKQFKNTELSTYLITVLTVTLGIMYFRRVSHVEGTMFDQLRRSFFSVASIVSTTGLANHDFSGWPDAAIGLLMIVYFTGSCVGSTAGGIKFARLNILWKYARLHIGNLVNNKKEASFDLDGITYTAEQASNVILNIVMYFLVFLLGGAILLMIVSPALILPDGTILRNNFSTSFQAALANLGNIGPTFEIDNYNIGPTGNYFAFSEAGKMVMFFLMYFGRVGVLSLIFLFISYEQPKSISVGFAEIEFEEGVEGHMHLKK